LNTRVWEDICGCGVDREAALESRKRGFESPQCLFGAGGVLPLGLCSASREEGGLLGQEINDNVDRPTAAGAQTEAEGT
jgi:hypothetical protein